MSPPPLSGSLTAPPGAALRGRAAVRPLLAWLAASALRCSSHSPLPPSPPPWVSCVCHRPTCPGQRRRDSLPSCLECARFPPRHYLRVSRIECHASAQSQHTPLQHARTQVMLSVWERSECPVRATAVRAARRASGRRPKAARRRLDCCVAHTHHQHIHMHTSWARALAPQSGPGASGSAQAAVGAVRRVGCTAG